MTLVSSSIYTFIATAMKMLTGLIINKFIAIYIGPSGLAVIGNFQSIVQLILTLSQAGIANGAVKYTAQYRSEGKNIAPLFSTTAKICLISSSLVGVSLILLSSQLSARFLNSEDYYYVLILLGLTAPLLALNSILISIINGLKEIRLWFEINIVQSLSSLFFATVLIAVWGLKGALVALSTYQSLVFFILLRKLKGHLVIKLSQFRSKVDPALAKQLFAYSIMALTSAVAVPVSHIIIREYIGSNLGWESAGYWQALWYISTMYLMVVTTSLGVYYLPRLSEIKVKSELTQELRKGLCLIVPFVSLMAFAIYLTRDLLIGILFSEEFLVLRDLLLWQLVGDVIKVAAWLIGYVTVARAMVKTFVVLEIFGSLTFVIISISFVSVYGLVGITYAYSLNYAVYLLVMLLIYRKIALK